MAIKGIPEKHKSKRSFGLRGREPWAITEAGLYRLVMRSNKPEASDFQDWVTDTVLPAIRKDGAYIKGEETAKTDAAQVWLRPLTLTGSPKPRPDSSRCRAQR